MNLRKYLKESCKYMLRSYPIIRPYVKEVEGLFTMGQEELNKRNEQRFLEIFSKAYDKSPFYHKLYTEAGIKKEDITCLADIKKLPIITKEMVKQNREVMLTVPRFMVHGGCTSGTTGTPLKVYKDWKAIWRSQAYLYVMRKKCGFTYGQSFVSLRGNLDKRDMMLKVHISNTVYFSSYNINPEKVKFYHEQIVKQKPVAIEGYPSSLYTLALMLRDAGLELYIPIAFTSSETLLDYQREQIEQQLHTEIFDLYGMTEESICLHETLNHKGYYEAPGFSINEYLEDGEICTSLINDAFPLIRYRSNDVIELYKGSEFEGNKFLIQCIEGRKEDYIVCKDGSKVMRLDFLFKGVSHVRKSQLIQKKDNCLLINIVPEEGFCDADRELVKQNLFHRLGERNIDYQIAIIKESEILYSSNGKFKYLINSKTVKV